MSLRNLQSHAAPISLALTNPPCPEWPVALFTSSTWAFFSSPQFQTLPQPSHKPVPKACESHKQPTPWYWFSAFVNFLGVAGHVTRFGEEGFALAHGLGGVVIHCGRKTQQPLCRTVRHVGAPFAFSSRSPTFKSLHSSTNPNGDILRQTQVWFQWQSYILFTS